MKGYKMDIKVIKRRISELCDERNWSYYRLAKEAGFQQSTLKSIIKEKNMPSLYTLSKICDAFGITLSSFFDDPLFETKEYSDKMFNSLWETLSSTEKEKVLIYMHGLLGKEIKKEDFKDEL